MDNPLPVHDLSSVERKEAKMALQTERYQDTYLYKIRHSTAHVMAQAVMEMFPDGSQPLVLLLKTAFIMTLTCRAISRRKTWNRSKSA
jgi:hypothetical protein